MKITILSVGAPPDASTAQLIDTYMVRFPRHIQIHWTYIKHGVGDRISSMQDEAEKILSKLPDRCKVILLDEKGIQLDSPGFANLVFNDGGGDICFIIGGAYGVTEAIKQRANYTASLSKLVFPHQLVRIVLTEQLYRAHTIMIDHPYHHV